MSSTKKFKHTVESVVSDNDYQIEVSTVNNDFCYQIECTISEKGKQVITIELKPEIAKYLSSVINAAAQSLMNQDPVDSRVTSRKMPL